MLSRKNQYVLKGPANEIKKTIIFFWKWRKVYLILLFLFISIITFLAAVTIYSYSSNPQFVFSKCNYTLDSIKLIVAYKFLLFFGAILFIIFFSIWIAMSWMVYPILKFPVNLLFSAFYQEETKFTKNYYKYNSFLKRKLDPKLNRILVPIIIAAFIYLIKKAFWKYPASDVINEIIVIILILIPIIWSFYWISVVLIYKKRKNKKSFRLFLFSRPVILASFREIIIFMIWIAILVRIMIPLLWQTSYRIGTKCEKYLIEYHDYDIKWVLLVNDMTIKGNVKDLKKELPEPKQISSSIHPLSMIKVDFISSKKKLSNILNQCFFIVMLGGLLSIGCPTIIGSILIKGMKKTLKNLTIVVLKTTLLALILQYFIYKAYFIDTSNIFGIGTLYLFLLNFFLTLESKNIEFTK